MDFFFGRPRVREPVYESYGDGNTFAPAPRRAPAKPRVKRAKPKAAATAPVAAEPVVVEKRPDAKKVLVVGDFIAGGLATGLQQAFAETPGILVEDRSEVSSGLVREDYFDWPDMLAAFADDVKPALIIISLGANDRQQMSVNGAREKFRSDLWSAEYAARVKAFADQARGRGVPLLWVGMPSFQSTAMSADMVVLNGIYRTEAEKAGGQFIDIWDGFVDENGKFVTTGSDVNGQQVRLRGADGITLTAAGKRKLAFYVEKDIRRLLGETAGDGAIPAASGMKDLLVSAPTSDSIIRTPPISLTDPELDGATGLLDPSAIDKGNGLSLRDKLIEKGEVATAPAGRIDDFRLAKPSSVISNPVMRN
ncbi:DUF459 domain-containing protein [Rhizobium sp. YIM 134829]|uniref:SGNH/GDSL hydrolase family protein n=1 Tax=Rhizobium sp. YIM 134829 TaxID=3390453 RepID=UPI00397DFA88